MPTTISLPPPLPRPDRPAEVRPALPQPATVAFATTPSTAPAVFPQAEDGATVETAVAGGDVLETGDRGAAVRDLQRRLNRLGYAVGVDGALGPATAAVVERFQGDVGVDTTGRVGPTTLLALRVTEARRTDIALAPLVPSVRPGSHLINGDRGIEVQTLQRLLSLAGHPVDADGVFGAQTRTALQDFQRAHRLTVSGELGPTTLQMLDRVVDARSVDVVRQLDLPAGYGSLEALSRELVRLDDRYAPTTPQGRATLALALAIGGTEVFGQGTTGTNFFTVLGGTDNNMRGFAQFNLDYHDAETRTAQGYASHLADILEGRERMPNSDPAIDHVQALTARIADGRIRNGSDLRLFLDRQGFGGSNWQGIDDGWHRVPGLADALVRFLQASAPATVPVFT